MLKSSHLLFQGYMSAFKCSMIDKYHCKSVPQQFQDQVWKRMLGKIRSLKYDYARKTQIRLFGSKEAASKNDKMALGATCLWSGTLDNAEFMNMFNAMVYNCGQGNEIAITHKEQLTMKNIDEHNMISYSTLQQHLHRMKTEGKSLCLPLM